MRCLVQLGPVLRVAALSVVVGVGGLHDLEVAPVGPGQVAELDQVGLVVDHIVTVGCAAQLWRPVDQNVTLFVH